VLGLGIGGLVGICITNYYTLTSSSLLLLSFFLDFCRFLLIFCLSFCSVYFRLCAFVLQTQQRQNSRKAQYNVDIYSFGIMCFEIWVDLQPFYNNNGIINYGHIAAILDKSPARFKSVISKAILRDPKQRTSRFNEIVTELLLLEAELLQQQQQQQK